MKTHKQKIGQIGEEIAENYLRENKFRIISRNYRKPWGEIDLIVQKGKSLHFVEVKTQMADFLFVGFHNLSFLSILTCDV